MFAFKAAANAIMGTDAKGNQIEYLIDAENKTVISQLLYYFGQDANNFKGDLHRGLILQGNVGSGKSKLIQIFQLMNLRPLIYKPTREIAEEFFMEGAKAMYKYCKGSRTFNANQTVDYRTFAFDDLGAETNTKYYGNECNVMAEIIQSRYEMFKDGMLTHYTTNLTKKEIEVRYGDRVLSRLEETCNWFTIGTGSDSTDRRVR